MAIGCDVIDGGEEKGSDEDLRVNSGPTHVRIVFSHGGTR
jgi:hypothetical protein